jgi:predicted N-acetyltransferase YhbS
MVTKLRGCGGSVFRCFELAERHQSRLGTPHRGDCGRPHARSKVVRVVRAFAVTDQMPTDAPMIEALLDRSFGIARRTKTSYRLREGSMPEPGLSLVVRDPEVTLAGAISFWPLRIGKSRAIALLLGPLVVHPERQNMGVGLALMREGLKRAKEKGFRLVLLVGDQPYYGRAGFQKLPKARILLPGPVNDERLLFLELVPNALDSVDGLALPPHRASRT